MTATQPIASGTVTFLFSDIEGSTRTRAAGRDRTIRRAPRTPPGDPARSVQRPRRDRARHRRRLVLRRLQECAVGRRGCGRQRSVVSLPNGGPTGSVVRVRIGIHSGEAELAGDSLVGLDINRAARIAAVAHGGQTLLSDATRALVQGHLPRRCPPARPRCIPAEGPPWPGARGPGGSPTICRPTSRRCAHPMPARTTCRPS